MSDRVPKAMLANVANEGDRCNCLAFPFELIILMDKYTDIHTHTRLRATCKHFRQFLPLQKVVDFKTLEILVRKYNINVDYYDNIQMSRAFQEVVHLDLSPASLTQEQFQFLCPRGLIYMKYVELPE